MCSMFCKHFISSNDTLKHSKPCKIERNEYNLFLYPVDCKESETVIESLELNLSTEVDNIPTKIL